MNRIFVLFVSGLALVAAGTSLADGWRSKYSTAGPGAEFEPCCGVKDCHTAEALGFPEIKRRDEGGYKVRLNGYWIEYDHPMVYPSEDSKTWVCFMGEARDNPDPLCLFLAPGVS